MNVGFRKIILNQFLPSFNSTCTCTCTELKLNTQTNKNEAKKQVPCIWCNHCIALNMLFLNKLALVKVGNLVNS